MDFIVIMKNAEIDIEIKHIYDESFSAFRYIFQSTEYKKQLSLTMIKKSPKKNFRYKSLILFFRFFKY